MMHRTAAGTAAGSGYVMVNVTGDPSTSHPDPATWPGSATTSPRPAPTSVVYNSAEKATATTLQAPAGDLEEDYSKGEKKESVVIGENEVHYIPVVLLLCFLVLYIGTLVKQEVPERRAMATGDVLESEESPNGGPGTRRLASIVEVCTSLACSYMKECLDGMFYA